MVEVGGSNPPGPTNYFKGLRDIRSPFLFLSSVNSHINDLAAFFHQVPLSPPRLCLYFTIFFKLANYVSHGLVLFLTKARPMIVCSCIRRTLRK